MMQIAYHPPATAAALSARVRHILIVSRLDPIKRVDLVFDALEQFPSLQHFKFVIVGNGQDRQTLEQRATDYTNVRLEGFCPNISAKMAESDLLLHLCPVEPFGLVILEAMAIGLPVLVPDRGGAATLVEPGKSGFHFRANDPISLSQQLLALARTSSDQLDRAIASAKKTATTRFAELVGLAGYRQLLLSKKSAVS